jgi:glutathione S-transferase
MLKIFGISPSRTARTLWLCRELGLQYEQVQVNFADATTKTSEFLAVNPSGKIPAIDDDGFHLAESMAINLYLAKKHGSPLLPKDLQGEALVWQWSFWVVTEVERPLLQLMLQRMPPLPDPQATKFFRERNPLNAEVEKASAEALQKPMTTLNNHLTERAYLLGTEFTLADFNVASVMTWSRGARLDLTPYPHVDRWFKACLSRPAARAK